MRKITLSEYNAIPEDYRGIWTVERWDLPDWAELRKKHIGKRTMMVYDKGTCCWLKEWALKSWMTAHGKSRIRSDRK